MRAVAAGPTSAGLSPLWAARSVAVVGASDRPGALGRLPVEFLQRYGYQGSVYPVRPDGATVAGLASYASVRDCPAPVDLAMLLVAAERVPAAIDDCVAAGVPVAIVCSSGFAETGPAGARLQHEVVGKAAVGGLRVVGPNCIGAVAVEAGLVASFSPLFSGRQTALVPGSIAFVSQSGALGYGAVSLAFERGLGLGWVVNTGNEADVTAVEVMAALAGEPACTAVLGYVEGFTDGSGLRRLAALGKPVALLVAGRSAAGQRAAASHTGALANGRGVVDAALSQYGIVAVDDVDELLDVGAAFAQPRRPAGPRVGVLTTSGGSGILAADAVERHGLELAELAPTTQTALRAIVPAYGSTQNPVDVTAAVLSDATLFDRALQALLDDDAVDVVLACFCVLTGDDADRVVEGLSAAVRRSAKPILAARTGATHLAPAAATSLRDAGVPTYLTPGQAVRAAAALWQVSRGRRSPTSASPAPARPAPPPGATETDLKALFSAAGLPVAKGRLAIDRRDAVAAVAEVGGSAVLKAVVPGLTHKSEAGGVALDVRPESAAQTYDRLAALGGEVLVEELVPPGVEVLVGATAGPLGTVLTLGPGGVLTEVIADQSMRLLPVDAHDVRAMVDETRLGTLLAGVRGRPPADVDALVATVVGVAELVAGWPSGFELDLNPVTVLAVGQGCRVLDAAYVAPGAP